MTKRAFGDLELEILQLFRSGKKLTVKQVQSLLGDQDKYTTVMTVMNRLAQKQKLTRERVGLHYEYWVDSTENQSPSIIQQMKKRLFGMKASAIVSYLIESTDEVSDQELLEMERMIQTAKKKRQKT